MAVNFVARKCTQCAGKLQYIKEKKIWKCLYCGAEIEREEQYDGLFTIKNVVRQALLDTAYRRLDSAERNITECEKIDSGYVGTLIAKITYEMIAVSTPGARSERDARNLLSMLKKNYEQLKSISGSVTEEEEALYDFLEESDIFAALVLVYDSLGDTERRERAASRLNAAEVYSKASNGNLLTYALKNGKLDMVSGIASNTDNIDVRAALTEILNKYPDGEQKCLNAAKLFSAGALKYEDKAIAEKYLANSADSVSTKASVLISALKSGIKPEMDTIVKNVLEKADDGQVREVVSVLCGNKLLDGDVAALTGFGISSGSAEKAETVLDCLKQGGQYLLISSRLLTAVLNTVSFSSDGKVGILKKCFEFKAENKAVEAAAANYLCGDSSPAADREKVLKCLFERAEFLSADAAENYVLRVTADGERKPEVVSAMFDMGLNVSFFNGLLSKYMNSGTDDRETKERVIAVLSERGLKADPGSVIDYICGSEDEAGEKIKFVKQMVRNGSQIRGDAANAYLERTPAEQFCPELFSLIFTPGSMFSAKGIEKYLLEISEGNKADNFITMTGHTSSDLNAVRCETVHLGSSICCNLLQAYILTTADPQQTVFDIADYMIGKLKLRINAEMTVSGSPMKLRKYAAANRERLSGNAAAVCEKYKVYTMLF